MIQYNIGRTCVQNYVRKYKESAGIPSGSPARTSQVQKLPLEIDISAYQEMSKEELINAAMEAINGWIKAEVFMDMHITCNENIHQEIADYIKFFNEERPA